MIKQFCLRTYDTNTYGYFESKYNCDELNSALKEGWKVVMVTPKLGYNEYILEKKFADKHAEYNFPEEKSVGGIGHGKELCEQEEGV